MLSQLIIFFINIFLIMSIIIRVLIKIRMRIFSLKPIYNLFIELINKIFYRFYVSCFSGGGSLIF